MGCVLTTSAGNRIAYSGDCIVDGRFSAAVGSCDVLIHEGTFTADFLRQAREIGHSTFGTAWQDVVVMQAKFLFVTHVSASVSTRETMLTQERVIVAFDHLSVAYEDMARAFQLAKHVLATQVAHTP
jgi:ribonuclease Z